MVVSKMMFVTIDCHQRRDPSTGRDHVTMAKILSVTMVEVVVYAMTVTVTMAEAEAML